MRMKLLYVIGTLGAVVFLTASTCTDPGTATTPGNTETYCDHGNRVYDDTSGHGLAVVPHDPSCPQPKPVGQ